MLPETLKMLFTRDLNRLCSKLLLYNDESKIWKIEGDVLNSAGNLCLHLVGNLNTYIGKEIGGTGYVRNRELEFSLKNISRTALVQKIQDTIEVINSSMDKLEESALQEMYPLLVFEEKTTTEYMMGHLATHLTYHLGQVNYHRRLIDK